MLPSLQCPPTRQICSTLGIKTVGELAALPPSLLDSKFPLHGTGLRVAKLARGVDEEEVKPRALPKSLSCGKTFL